MHLLSSPAEEYGVAEVSRGLLFMLDLSIRDAEIAQALPLSKRYLARREYTGRLGDKTVVLVGNRQVP